MLNNPLTYTDPSGFFVAASPTSPLGGFPSTVGGLGGGLGSSGTPFGQFRYSQSVSYSNGFVPGVSFGPGLSFGGSGGFGTGASNSGCTTCIYQAGGMSEVQQEATRERATAGIGLQLHLGLPVLVKQVGLWLHSMAYDPDDSGGTQHLQTQCEHAR